MNTEYDLQNETPEAAAAEDVQLPAPEGEAPTVAADTVPAEAVQAPKRKRKRLNAMQLLILHLIVVIAVVWGLFGCILGLNYAPNNDMSPNVRSGDLLLYYRLEKSPKAQDVIVLKKNSTMYVGRIVAAPGDSVEVTDSEELIINGNSVYETNIYSPTPKYEGFVEYPVTLGKDEYFVLSDSRNGGEDSRYYGTVSKDEIKGVVILVLRRSGI